MRFTQKNDIGEYIIKSIADFKKTLKESEIWTWGEGSFDPTKHKFIENATRILNTRNLNIAMNDNDLGVLEVISGGVDFRKSNIKNLGNLRIIGSTTDFRESEVKSLGNLQMIGGMVDFSDCKFDSLNKLEVIGSGVTFGKNIKDLGSLSVIGGYANFEGNKKVKSLGNLLEIYGELFFGVYKSSSIYLKAISSITSLGKLSYIDGDVDFEGTNVENLGNLSRIEGYANFSNSKVSNLGILKYLKNYDANGVLLTKEDIKQHLRKMNTVSVIPKDLIYLSQKFLNQRKFILKIKNIDKYEKHYEEVGFNKKDLAPENNRINGDWFTSTDDKNIAEQLVDDGFVEIYNEKQNNVYAIVNRTPLDLGMNRAFDITNGESGIRFTNDGMLVFYEV